MKTRIIQTKFWEDNLVGSLTMQTRYLFIYLLTCSRINCSGVFELSDKQILLDTDLPKKELEKAKNTLQAKKRVLFCDGWVKVVNSEKYNNYKNFSAGEKCYLKEVSSVPQSVLDGFNQLLNEYSASTPISNNTEIINKKSEIRVKKTTEEESRKVLEVWNDTYGTKFSSTISIEGNLEFWLKQYSLDQILEAVRKIKDHKYWCDKMRPDTLLRRKNPRGDSVDYIGEMLNQSTNQEQYYA